MLLFSVVPQDLLYCKFGHFHSSIYLPNKQPKDTHSTFSTNKKNLRGMARHFCRIITRWDGAWAMAKWPSQTQKWVPAENAKTNRLLLLRTRLNEANAKPIQYAGKEAETERQSHSAQRDASADGKEGCFCWPPLAWQSVNGQANDTRWTTKLAVGRRTAAQCR